MKIAQFMKKLWLLVWIIQDIDSFPLWLYVCLYKSGLKLGLSWSTPCEIHLRPWLRWDQKLSFESGTQPETGSDRRIFMKSAPAVGSSLKCVKKGSNMAIKWDFKHYTSLWRLYHQKAPPKSCKTFNFIQLQTWQV